MAKRSFFESMGNASLERFHSAFIGYLLSDNYGNRAFTLDLISCWLGKSLPTTVKDIEVFYEFLQTDILIWIDKTHVIVIENKLKSDYNATQLSTYHTKITSFFGITACDFYYLSMGTAPLGLVLPWEHITYNDFYNCISSLITKHRISDLYLLEYSSYIKTLIDISNDFILRPDFYPSVFQYAGMEQSKRFSVSTTGWTLYQKFVFDNKYETLLQKLLINKLVNDLTSTFPSISKVWQGGDSHGKAHFGIEICKYTTGITPTDYVIQFQMQFDNTNLAVAKLVVEEENYATSTYAAFRSHSVPSLYFSGFGIPPITNVEDLFNIIQSSPLNKGFNHGPFPSPPGSRNKGRISLTKHLGSSLVPPTYSTLLKAIDDAYIDAKSLV
jgi:hypothetical protein